MNRLISEIKKKVEIDAMVQNQTIIEYDGSSDAAESVQEIWKKLISSL
jgi:hypothetical protein